MTDRQVQIVNTLGLHARAAAKFVHLANQFSAKITLGTAGKRVDGKSILGLLTLAASKGTRLTLTAAGEDEEGAVDALAGLIAERFGEPE